MNIRYQQITQSLTKNLTAVQPTLKQAFEEAKKRLHMDEEDRKNMVTISLSNGTNFMKHCMLSYVIIFKRPSY